MLGVWLVTSLLPALGWAVVQDTVPFKTVARGTQSGIEETREAVVRTAAEWKALCASHSPGQPCAAADFTKTTILGVFLGTRPTAGFAVEVTGVVRDGDALVVTYRERRPGPDEMAAQMLTAPFHLVSVERFSGPVRFRRTAS